VAVAGVEIILALVQVDWVEAAKDQPTAVALLVPMDLVEVAVAVVLVATEPRDMREVQGVLFLHILKFTGNYLQVVL
jgi:hypothetical protein